jgi:hypothetical protein
MNKSELFDAALEKLVGDMDDLEGRGAMSHSMDECPDPLGCTMHDDELGDGLTKELNPGGHGDEPAAVKIEVKKLGMPTMEGAKEDDGPAEDKLDPEDIEALKKLLR